MDRRRENFPGITEQEWDDLIHVMNLVLCNNPKNSVSVVYDHELDMAINLGLIKDAHYEPESALGVNWTERHHWKARKTGLFSILEHFEEEDLFRILVNLYLLKRGE